jgi:type I restriction enzyme, S subunit
VEQTKLADEVQSQLSLIEQVDAELEAQHKAAQSLRQSILAAAFSGKLVPQDPADEPASVLLERLRVQKAAAPASRQSRRAEGTPIADRAALPPSAGESRQRRVALR